MLQRASGLENSEEECDAMTKLICNADPENALCPEACRPSEEDEPEEPTVVKAGDLVVTAKASTSRKVILNSASDTDTLKFRTSENVTITKVTLERYGYSTSENLSGVRLEDGEGNVIAEMKPVNSKDRVTLSIKKDYRNVDGSLDATVVVLTKGTPKAGATIGFKVVDVESSAENLNLDDYEAYTYEIVDYDAVEASVEMKGNEKDYNFEAGEMYEIARVKVNASTGALLVKGFTLTNSYTGTKLDMEEFLDKLTVKVDNKVVDGLKYSVNKDNQLVISFDEYEIASKKNTTFVVEASLTEDFDEYRSGVSYTFAKSSDINAVEKKTGSRIHITSLPSEGVNHQFKGGKIKFTNTKVSKVDAAQGSEDVVIAQGNVSVSEAVNMNVKLRLKGAVEAIDEMKVFFAGEEYTANSIDITAGSCSVSADKTKKACLADTVATCAQPITGQWTGAVTTHTSENCTTGFVAAHPAGTWTESTAVVSFNNVTIEKSGKVEFTVSLKDEDIYAGETIQATQSFSKINSITNATYDESNEAVVDKDFVGSISIANLTIQAAKGALTNNSSSDIEFLTNDSTPKAVFDGTYKAKKGDLTIKEFEIKGTSRASSDENRVTFYLYIDGENVGSTEDLNVKNSLDEYVELDAGEEVSVKIEAEIEGYNEATYDTYVLRLYGRDGSDNEAGYAHDDLNKILVKETGTVNVSTAAANNTVLRAARKSELAQFTVTPKTNGTKLETLVLDVTSTDATFAADDIELEVVGGDDLELSTSSDITNGGNTIGKHLVYSLLDLDIDGGETIKVLLTPEIRGSFNVELKTVNTKPVSKSFSKRFEDAIVYVKAVNNLKGTTEFEMGVDADDEYSVSALTLTFDVKDAANSTGATITKTFSDGEKVTASGIADVVRNLIQIDYTVTVSEEAVEDDLPEGYTCIDETDGICASYSYPVQIKRDGSTGYSDFFKVGGVYASVFASNA